MLVIFNHCEYNMNMHYILPSPAILDKSNKNPYGISPDVKNNVFATKNCSENPQMTFVLKHGHGQSGSLVYIAQICSQIQHTHNVPCI